MLFIGFPYSSVSSSKYFFLFTKLTTSNHHLTSRTYFSFSQHADSSDHPRLHLILLYPELAVWLLLIIHYHASVPNNGTLFHIMDAQTVDIFKKLNLICLNKCTVINSMILRFAPLNNFVLILAQYKFLLIDWLILIKFAALKLDVHKPMMNLRT